MRDQQPMEALIIIIPPEVYGQAYLYSCMNTVALLAVHLEPDMRPSAVSLRP